MKKIYQYEVGVLLDKTNEEYEAYACVWDKKHGYYNEDYGIELSLDSAVEFVKNYVNSGIKNTYGIISEITVSDTRYEEIQNDIEINGYCTNYEMNYSMDNVIKFYKK